MNKQKLSLLMRARTAEGRALDAEFGAFVEKTYTEADTGVHSAVLGSHAPFLNPSMSYPLVRIKPPLGSIRALLAYYLGSPLESAEVVAPVSTSPLERSVRQRLGPVMSEEDLNIQLERKSCKPCFWVDVTGNR